jgi:hypoxanthine phosphoribosyltransferase
MHSYYPEDFQKDIIKISDEVCKNFPQVDCIFGIARGGLVAATALSYRLNVPLQIIEPKLRSGFGPYSILQNHLNCNKSVLVVDDMIDSGNVIRNILDYCKRYNINEPNHNWYHSGDLRTAVLIYNTAQKIVPDFYGRTIDRNKNMDYITFFWEKAELCQ